MFKRNTSPNTTPTVQAVERVTSVLGAGIIWQGSLTGSGTQTTPVAKISEEKDMFIKLLSAEIQNQNPLEPMDNSQFIQQLTQFSTVEQLTQLNSGFETMLKMQEFMQARELIGSKVDYTDASGAGRSGVVEGVSLDSSDNGTDVNLIVDGNSVAFARISVVRAADPE